MAFSKNDVKMHGMLKSVIAKGDFEVKGEAVTTVAALFQWYDELAGKIGDAIPKPLKPTELKEPIQKIRPEKEEKKSTLKAVGEPKKMTAKEVRAAKKKLKKGK